MYLNFRYGTLETLSDDPEELIALVDVAFKIYSHKWNKLYDTTQLEYNPIWNYDGSTETTEVRGARHEVDTVGGSRVVSDDRTAPFDSGTVRAVGQNETNIDEHEDEHTKDTYTDVITEVRGGNQGTTTTQQMIKEEREISDFNMFDIIMFDIINMITYPYFGEV